MNRTFCVLLLSLLVVAPALSNSYVDTFETYLEAGFEQVAHEFGGLQLIREAEELYESVVFWPKDGFLSEANHILDVYTAIARSIEDPSRYNVTDIITCNPGPKSDYFKFAPLHIGSATIGNTISFSGFCFANNTATLKVINNNTVVLEHVATNPSSWDCSDTYLFANTQNFHFTTTFFKGLQKTTFSGLTASQMAEITRTGIQMFGVCDSLTNVFPDILKTVLMFAGGITSHPNLPFIGSHPTFWMVRANVEFIKHATGYQWQKRANSTFIELDPSHIHSGDFIAVTRMDGLDQIIEWGAGSHAGHSVIAIWVEGELMFAESQAAWYWPRENIQMNPYKTWLQWARNAGYQVTHLPLKPEWRSKFNESAAYEWYKTKEGIPYGYHNFLFGWIDTETESYPPILSAELLAPVLGFLERYIEPVGMIFNEGINFRLNTTNKTIAELAEIAYERNLTWAQIIAMPELDEWSYTDGNNLVCSSFVVGLWKAGGLFGDLNIQATEFTPRDAYSMIWIDPNPELPQVCKDTDPGNPYCQIMGEWRMEFPQISTVEPYDHMNERCPSLVSNGFARVEGC